MIYGSNVSRISLGISYNGRFVYFLVVLPSSRLNCISLQYFGAARLKPKQSIIGRGALFASFAAESRTSTPAPSLAAAKKNLNLKQQKRSQNILTRSFGHHPLLKRKNKNNFRQSTPLSRWRAEPSAGGGNRPGRSLAGFKGLYHLRS